MKMAIYTQKCEQKRLKINNRRGGRGVGIKMSWVEKNRKINIRVGGGGGRDYSGLESRQLQVKLELNNNFSSS